RPDRAGKPRVPPGEDTEKKPADDTERCRDEDRGERDHRALPLAEDEEEREAAQDERGEPPPPGPETEEREEKLGAEPGQGRKDLDRKSTRLNSSHVKI